MPFLLSPVLWDRLTRRFRVRAEAAERAHGDGLAVGADSPEAFEEVFWRRGFPHKVTREGIALWQEPDDSFGAWLREQMRKVILLRQPDRLASARYVSKNNGNVARVPALAGLFPDAAILIPFREPLQQAISLWRQHERFTARHAADPFVRKYMSDLGHDEFGAAHRPILFPGFPALAGGRGPDTVDYWLAYWIAAFEHLRGLDEPWFLSYERLCQDPAAGLSRLTGLLELPADDEALGAAARVFRAPPAPREPDSPPDPALVERAGALHHELLARCLLAAPSPASPGLSDDGG
jgi:hypothetical protein